MRKFVEKIKEQQYKQSTVIVLKYVLLVAGILCLMFNLFAGVYFISANHLGEKFLFALSLKITLALTMVYFALQLNREILTQKQAARLLDRKNDDKSETYLNALELREENGETDSPILGMIYEQADELAVTQQIGWELNQLKKIFTVVGLIVLANVIFALVANPAWSEAMEFFSVRSLPEVEHKTTIDLEPGNMTVVRGTNVDINLIEPEAEVEHVLFYKQHDLWRENELVENSYNFSHLEKTTEYFIQNQYATSDTFLLKVLELPAIKEIGGKVEYPQYTKLPAENVEGGNFSVLAGSKIKLKITANNPIQTAQLVQDEHATEMERLGKSSFSYLMKPEKSGSYYLNLTDILGNESQPILYEINLRTDARPEIEIVHPVADTTISQDLLLPLVYLASDDFGLDEIILHYYKNAEEPQQKKLKYNLGHNLWKADYVFDLNNLALFPGDVVSYWLQVSDNSPQTNKAQTSIHTARLPSIEEIYAEVAAEEELRQKTLEESKLESEELNEKFEEKRRELMKKDELDWEDKQDLQKLLQDQEKLSENVDKMAESYQQMKQKLEKNQALSAETLEKMERISELMQEISDDKLREKLKDMQKSLENMDAEEVKAALDELKFSLEEFNEKIERTLQMLEDIKKEQALQKASDISKEMQKMQEELNKKTEESSESNSDLAEKQDAIKEKLEALQEQLQEASEMMNSEQDAEMQQEMEELQEQMEQDKLAEDLQEASENLQNDQKQQAMENQQSAQQKMEKMNKKLGEMSQMMGMMGMQIDMESIDIAIQRLLVWSAEHEDLANSYHDDPYILVEDLVANFEGLNQTLQELYNTPMIFLVLGQKFFLDASNCSKAYRELFLYINDAKKSKVPTYLLDIQSSLNLMIYDLMQAKDNMQSSSGGGGGMQSLMQSLQQMGEQQMMMNMMTNQMMQQLGQGGKISSKMRQEMGKLAGDEQRLADNLKRAIQNNPEAQKQVNSLNKIIEDLESISRNLKHGRINQEIIDTQERILSRLLDAQKSIHQREFSKKRKAESSEIDAWDTPEEIKLKFEKMRRKALLDDDIEKYTPYQQELIREYLKKLNAEE